MHREQFADSQPQRRHIHSLNPQESPSARPELERESDRLKLLLDMSAALVSTLECRDLRRTVSASIRQVMHYDIVGVWLPDVEHVYLRQLAMDFPESKGSLRRMHCNRSRGP